MRAKVAQENLIEAAGQPYTIVRSTQFFESRRAIADSATEAGVVRVPGASLQPIAAVDVAAAVTDVAVSDPINGVIEIAGPQAIKFPELMRAVLAADQDPRAVAGDEHARSFGPRDDHDPPGTTARARMIGVVPGHPEYNATAELTLGEHLPLAVARGQRRQRRLRSALSSGRRDAIRELARQAGLGLDQRLGVTVGTLSAGQRPATALVMALATSPALLLLDEYTANLDPWAAQRLRAVTALLSR